MTTAQIWQAHDSCNGWRYSARSFRSSAVLAMLEPSKIGGSAQMSEPLTRSPKQPVSAAKRPCPDCGASLVKRSSRCEHALLSKTFLVCKNPVCGATFAGHDEITHRLSPPSQPNPEISLPYASSVIRRGVLLELGLQVGQEALPAPSVCEDARA